MKNIITMCGCNKPKPKPSGVPKTSSPVQKPRPVYKPK